MTSEQEERNASQYQQPDGTPKKTGRTLHESVVTIRVDDDRARSNYTLHVEHPNHDGGVRCFFRNSREMVVSGLRKHLDRLTDGQITCVEVIDEAGLELSGVEIRPDSYDRTGPFSPETPDIEVVA